MFVGILTVLMLNTFAANSLLCRIALGGDFIDHVSFTTLRLASSVYLYWLSAGSLTTKSGHFVAGEADKYVETRNMVLMG
jgi:hypothetical protein